VQKKAEPIEMPLGLTHEGPRNPCVRWDPDPPQEGALFSEPAHCNVHRHECIAAAMGECACGREMSTPATLLRGMAGAVNLLRPKVGKFSVHLRQRMPNLRRICGRNYRNTKEPNTCRK